MLKKLNFIKKFATNIKLNSVISKDDIDFILRKDIKKEKAVTFINEIKENEIENENIPNKTDFSKIEVKMKDKIYLVSKNDDKIIYEEKEIYSKIEKILQGKIDKPKEIEKFVYDLPIPNVDPEIISLEEVMDLKKESVITNTINLFNELSITKDSSFEQFEYKLKNYYNFENDLYKDVEEEFIKTDLLIKEDKIEKDLINLNELSEIENISEKQRNQLYMINNNDKNKNILITHFKNDIIPVHRIKDEKHMELIRDCFEINLNMPGSIEFEDTNRFIPDWRPIEDFKKLPIIPISDILKKDFDKKLEKYHRKKFIYEIKRENVMNFALIFFSFLLFYTIISFILEKDEEISIEYERKKIEKLTNS